MCTGEEDLAEVCSAALLYIAYEMLPNILFISNAPLSCILHSVYAVLF